ncbi:MAG: CPBP family intramembrane metalloprotease, partial [Lentisphaeria bacterium]|nr:CPBP family intramembrane metalloprotease [Lentisphaeria bacterium]
AVMLTISVFAQSFKEAQNYLTPVYLLVIIPVILSGLPGIDLTTKSALVPVLNVALLMKELLVEAPSKDLIIIVLIANCLYSVISLLIAVRVFQSEEILLGGDKNWREIFRIKKNGMQLPSLEMGISFFALGLIFYFYIGSMLQKPSNLIEGVVLSQYLLLLAPAIILAILFKYNKRETFSLKTPGALQTVAVFMMGLSSWIVLSFVASIVQGYILKEPPIISEMMNQALGLTSDKYPLLVILFAFAVTPAICEEIFFRGMIMSGLRQRLPKWYAIGLTAIFFGIFHVSIYKIVPTAIIGLVVTWIVWETGSIFAGMLFHFMHNALGLLVMKLNWFPELMVEDKMNWAQFSGFVVLFIAGLVLFIYATRKKAEAVLPDSAEIPENSQEA